MADTLLFSLFKILNRENIEYLVIAKLKNLNSLILIIPKWLETYLISEKIIYVGIWTNYYLTNLLITIKEL